MNDQTRRFDPDNMVMLEELESRIRAYIEPQGGQLYRADDDDPEELGYHYIVQRGMAHAIDVGSYAREHGLLAPGEYPHEWR